MNEKTLSTKSAKLIFDYVIISVLAVNLIYSLLLPLIENSILVTVFSYICTPICIVLGVYAYSVKYKAPVLSVLKDGRAVVPFDCKGGQKNLCALQFESLPRGVVALPNLSVGEEPD